MKYAQLAERQILKAQAEGQLDNLRGVGKPLNLDGDHSADAAGFRIMAEAGALPREIALRNAVSAQTVVVRRTIDLADRKRESAKLADLQLRLDIEQDARRKFQRD